MSFRIVGVDPTPFTHLYGRSDAELIRHRARRVVADARPGYPERTELRDLDPGERALLVNYVHQPAATPYRASHAIYVREGAERARAFVDVVPEAMRVRTLSLRGFDAAGMMVDAELVEGTAAAAAIGRLLANAEVAEVHVHYAKFGCFAARVERA